MSFLPLLLQLIVDASFSWVRMFIALFISIALSLLIGVYAATNETAEKIVMPVVDVLQTLPILAFFPLVIYLVIVVFGIFPYYIGVNAAVIFLIITSMLWNIIFGVYESIKTLPIEIMEVATLHHFSLFDRMTKIYIPASLPRISEQSILSWSIGLFYLVTSEIFSIGNANYQVQKGIGAALVQLSGNPSQYLLGLAVFIAFVIATIYFFFQPFERYATRYTKGTTVKKRAQIVRERPVFQWIAKRVEHTSAAVERISVVTKEMTKNMSVKNVEQIKKRRKLSLYAALAVVIIAGVYVAVSFKYIPYVLGNEGLVLTSLTFSFARIWLAYLAAVVIAVPVCIYLIFVSKRSSNYLVLFQILASLPATIILPLIATYFTNYPEPLRSNIIAFIIFLLGGIWYIIFSILSNATSIPRSVFEVKDMFRIKGYNAFKNIYFKAILPGLITGSITGIAAEWNASIVAEYFTSAGIAGGGTGVTVFNHVKYGIGTLLDNSISTNAHPGILALAIINLVVMILLVNAFLWKRLYKNVAKVYR